MAFVLLLVSCGEDGSFTSGQTGFLITLNDEADGLTTRSTPSQIGKPTAEYFKLKIVKDYGTNSDTVYDGAYSSSLIPASAGSYTVSAFCGNNEELAYDSPYYFGAAQAQVADGAAVSVSIPCTVANSLLSVRFSNPKVFDSQYSSYGVRVSVGDKSLELTSSNSGKSAYFRAGSSVGLTFHGVLADNGQEVSMKITDSSLPETFAAGTHTILSLTASVPTSGVILTVDKVEVENVSIAATIPMEWLPKPVVSGFSGQSSIDYLETSAALSGAAISYSAYSAVQEVEFSLAFRDSEYSSYNGSYVLSTLSSDVRSSLAAIGISLPSIDGVSSSGAIDLSALTAGLKTDNGEDVSNVVSVRVKANNRWSSDASEDFTIVVKKPVFTVSVLPEEIWTKEFTAEEVSVTGGDSDKVKSDLTYEYSADGGSTWLGFNDVRRQVFSSVPDNKSYKVRACYRGCCYSSNVADVALESPAQLPNSNMESWQAVKVGGGSIFLWKSYYDFLPYASGETDVWWATNNQRSRDYSVSPVDVTTSPCVSYTESVKHGGSRSALIYTSGHGGGYASTITIVYPDGAFAGSLFVGSYSWKDDTETITTGHSFAVRPTKFTFWYKYVPKNSDQFKAYIELRNGTEVIASGTYIPTAYSSADESFVQASVPLVYSELRKKATSVYVQFLSTTKTSFSKSDFTVGESITFPVMGSWNAHIGSKLYIDDLNLEYSK